MTIAAERDFVSIGQLAANLQRPVRRIEMAATVLELEPALRLNNVPYFDGEQVEQISQVLLPNQEPT